MERCEVAVVGLGAIGAATAYQLAKSGVQVVGFDRFDPPHSFGSSHGDTRITREIYNSGPQLPLVRRSHEIWREIEDEVGMPLLMTTGGLFIGSGDTSAGWIDDIAALAEVNEIEHQRLDAADVAREFPAFRLSGNEPVVYEPNAGVLRPEACIDAQLSLAQRAGAHLHPNESVLQIEPKVDGVVISTEHSRYFAERVIVTTGAWVRSFMPSEAAEHIKTYRQVLHWFDLAVGAIDRLQPGKFPVFVWQVGSDSHQMFYGFPAMDGPTGGLKIATEQYEQATDPDELDRNVSDDEIRAMYETFASRIDGLLTRSVKTAACMYTVTSDWEYVVDWAPYSDRVLLASTCMGRGFKHSAALGESLAQLVSEGSSSVDLSSYKFGNRFCN